MSDAWEDMTDIEKASALELMGGKRQANILSSVITNFETVEDVIKTSMDSSGSAMAENEKVMNSIQGKIELFNNALQKFWSNLISSDMAKGFVDSGTTLINFLDTLHGKIIALIAAASLLAKTKGFSLKGLSSSFIGSIQQMATAQQSLQSLPGLGNSMDPTMISKYAAAVAQLTAQQQANMLASKQLSQEQIKYALSINGVSDAVIQEAMAQGRAAWAKKEALTTEQLYNQNRNLTIAASLRAQAQTSSEADKAKLLALANQIAAQSYEELTEERLKALLASQALEDANDVEILDNIIAALAGVGSGAEKAGKGLSTMFSAFAGTFASNPLGTILTIATTLFTFVPLIKNWMHDSLGMFQTTDDYVGKWKELKSQIEDINSEIKTTRDRIKELESQSVLSFVDKQELATLRQTNDELERRLRLTQNEAKEAAENTQKSVKEDYKKFKKEAITTNRDQEIYNIASTMMNALNEYMQNPEVNVWDSTLKGLQEFIKTNAPEVYGYMSTTTWGSLDSTAQQAVVDTLNKFEAQMNELDFITDGYGLVSGETYIDQAIQKIQEYKSEIYDIDGTIKEGLEDQYVVDITTNIGELESDLASVASELYGYLDDYGSDVDDEFTQSIKSQLERIDMTINPIEFYDKKFDEVFGKYSEQQKTLYELANQGVLTADALNGITYAPLMSELSSLGITAQDVAEHINALSQIERAKVLDPSFAISDYTEDLDKVQDKISAYKQALDSLQDGSFTFSDFIDLIQQFPELAEGVDVASGKFNGLSKNLAKAIKNAPDDLVDELKKLKRSLEDVGKSTDEIDQLIESIESMPEDALDDAISKYGSLIDQITAAKAAQEELNTAMSKNPNEGFETRSKAIEQIKALLKKDAIGSESELWDIAEAYGFDFESAKSLRENANALYEFVKARERWYKTDKDGNATYKGTENFIKAAEKAIDSKAFADALYESLELAKKGIQKEDFNVSDYIKWDYDNGVFDFDFDNANWDAIVKALSETSELTGLTSDEFTDLLTQIGMFFDVNWQDVGDVSDYMKTVADSSGTAEEKIKTMTSAVEKYVEKALGQDIDFDNLTEDVVNGLGEIDPEIKQLLLDYLELKKTLNEDPLQIKSTIDKEGADGLLEIQELLGAISKNEDGTISFNLLNLRDTLSDLGYTSATIDEVINKIKEYNSLVKTPPSDPLGINNSNYQTTTQSIISGLKELGAAYKIAQGETGEPLSVEINSEDLVTQLAESGWTASQISTYMSDLQSAISENNLNITINGDTSLSAIQQITDNIGTIPTAAETVHTTTTNADVVVPQINSYLESIPRAITTTHTIVTNTVGGYTDNLPPGHGSNNVNGTAHAQGTAYKTGSWGAENTETALVGELGPELLVRDGRWTTIGQNGAEFTQIKKGDIIFNHKQTESLLKNGYVTGRGRAYAEGTAFVGGTAYASGGGAHKENAYAFSDTSSKFSSAAKEFSDDFEETFDWIEVRLEEINESIDLNSAKLENVIGAIEKNVKIDEIISLNRTLYDNLIAGSTKYYEYAEKILADIPAQYHEAVKDGSIDIELFKGEANEKILEAIEEYRDWVQKGADATQQAEEVITEIADLAKEAFDNIVEDYENKTSIADSKKDQLDAYNALIETDLGAESESIYQAMIEETKKNVAIITEQRNAMQAELNKRVESGEIQKYSQHWYDAINEISEVDTQIIELTTDIEDYQDSINELHWDNFDNLIDRLQMVSDEAGNLIDILSSKDLVDKDTAEWTDEGITALGLYAHQMEVAEIQANKYKEEIDYLNKNWKKLGYTEQEYVEKLDELKDGQYDAIKAYNDTKDAIVDLKKERIDAIKSAIEREIEAYEELIDKKKEELDAEKDLYDFQKSVTDQQKEIADIERKLAALSADNSASARAQRAKLQAELAKAQQELQDTYYDRSIEDQQNALDKELENFQETKDKEMEGWDEYLENTEQVVSDSLAIVQANTDLVYQTLQSMGEEYSLSITESLTSPWIYGESALQSYSEKFGLTMSSTVEELQKLASEYQKVMDAIDDAGNEAVSKVNNNANTYQNNSTKQSTDNSSTAQVKKNIEVGGKINAGSAKIYSYIGDISGTNQYYANDPIYKVLKIDGDWVQVRHHKLSTGVTGWFKKGQISAYAKGIKSVDNDQFALIDELGDELIIRPSNGRMTFLEKGSGVVPADLTANLMEWGKLDPSNMLDQNRPQVTMSPSIVNNTMEIKVDASVGELIHVDNMNGNNPAEITKIIDKAWDKRMKELNAHIRRYTSR